MKHKIGSWVWQSLILIIIYVLVGNSRSIQPNPYIPGAVIAVNMIIPIIGGILFGKRVGFLTGLFGPLSNAIYTGSKFEYLAIVPLVLVGFLAGAYNEKAPSPVLAFLIVVAQALTTALYALFGLVPVFGRMFWFGLGYESFIGVLGIVVITTLYRIVFFETAEKPAIERKKIAELSTEPKIWIILAVIFLVLTGIISLLFYFKTIFIVFIIGIVLIIFIENLITNFHQRVKRFHMSKTGRRFLLYSMAFFWMFTIYFLIGGSITQLNEVANADVSQVSSTYMSMINPYIPTILGRKIFTQDTLTAIQEYIFSSFTSFLGLVTSIAFNSVIILPLMFYMYFRRWKKIEKRISGLLPVRYKDAILNASREIRLQLRDFLSAKVIESTVIGAICCLGFHISGLKGWLFLGVLAGILNIIPYIGPVLGAIPPVLIGILDAPIIALFALVTVIVAQLVDNLYLNPFMIPGMVKIDALLSIVLILIAAQVAGPLGMILALPIYLVYKITLREAYLELEKVYSRT